MKDDELAGLLRSPALALDPPVDLVEGAHRGARRVRRRRVAGASALSVVAVAAAALVVPSLTGGSERGRDTVAADLAARFERATSSVEVLERVNGGDVVTFYSGTRWCTASVRTLVNDGCRGFVGSDPVAPFALYLPPGDTTLRIDADTLTAGVLGTGVERVEVRLTDGRVLPAQTVSGEGFPRPVWWAAVPRGAGLAGYAAYDAAGEEVASVVLTSVSDEYEVEAEPAG